MNHKRSTVLNLPQKKNTKILNGYGLGFGRQLASNFQAKRWTLYVGNLARSGINYNSFPFMVSEVTFRSLQINFHTP